jgi:hypothetical protein
VKCGPCGGFYNEKCPHWPACRPAETDEQPDFVVVATLAAEKAVQKTFSALGVNISSEEAIRTAQGDFRFLRSLRFNAQKARTAALCSIAALMASGIGWAVWYAVTGSRAAE